MAAIAIVDTGFLVALLSERDRHHAWARSQAARYAAPWLTCESVLSETFHVLRADGWRAVFGVLHRGTVVVRFDLAPDRDRIFAMMEKYISLPMSLADACLVRMTEIVSECMVLTTDSHFSQYRRHGRQVVPCELAG